MSWDDEAATWDDDPAVQAYSRAALRSLRDALSRHDATLAGARILDFGCGTGLLTAAMAAEADHVVALDVSRAMIDRVVAKRLPNVTAVAGRLADRELGRFDLVTCSSVCAFVEDYPATARGLASLLVPGGLYVQWDWELDPGADEAMGLSRGAIQNALTAAGLTEVTVDIGFEEPFGGMTMAPLRGVGRKA